MPEGYDWGVLISWGDPVFPDVGPFEPAGGGSFADSDKVFGENTDGMFLYQIDGRQVIAVNHEYVNPEINLPNGAEGAASAANSAEDVRKLQNLHGVTIMEVAETGEGGAWQVVLDSPLNRRIHSNTEMRIAGPAAGHEMMKTNADPEGAKVLGTMNNCGSGPTPWGTYLTCEENFNGYFGAADPEIAMQAGWERYGIGAEGRYGYEKFDPRFDLSQEPNEPNRFGWIVEIDPADPTSVPVKRTALGRIKHECAAVAIAPDGRAVVYTGDDERGEFIYRFVSSGTYAEGGDNSALLDDGTLYVAKFDPDGTGTWLALTPETTGMPDLATVLILAREAGSAVGATTMDRPEWVQISPVTSEVYCTLTNNSAREAGATNAGGDAMEPQEGGPNPRPTNDYGQIVRWRPDGDDHTADGFTWNLFVMAGNPEVYPDNAYSGSENVTPGNMFNSPDGMGIEFERHGLDPDRRRRFSNEGDFAGMGNNQMLVGNPETRRDRAVPDRPERLRGDRAHLVGGQARRCSSASSIRAGLAGERRPAAALLDDLDPPAGRRRDRLTRPRRTRRPLTGAPFVHPSAGVGVPRPGPAGGFGIAVGAKRVARLASPLADVIARLPGDCPRNYAELGIYVGDVPD